MSTRPEVVQLTEYVPLRLPADRLSQDEGERFWQRYGRMVAVEFPSPKTDHRWQLTAQGWVGYLALSPQIGLSLQPKVPLQNLFRMIEVAYALDMLHLGEKIFHCDTLTDFFEQLALLLARRVQQRYRVGLYQGYTPRRQDLDFVRGQINVGRTLTMSQPGRLHCRYDEQTVDVEENQILLWTLWAILRSGFCSGPVYETIRHIYRMLAGSVSLQVFTAEDCERRVYNQLTEAYRPLHALCRFFLDQRGPAFTAGEREMPAFLIDMARLYERFVAGWLRANVGPDFQVRVQERIHFGEDAGQSFVVDMVIYDAESGAPLAVLDTKYKSPGAAPSAADLAQVVAYATAKQATEAILIYPGAAAHPFDERIGPVRVRALPFVLDGDVDVAGRRFWEAVVRRVC